MKIQWRNSMKIQWRNSMANSDVTTTKIRRHDIDWLRVILFGIKEVQQTLQPESPSTYRE